MNKKENIIIGAIAALALAIFITMCVVVSLNSLPAIDISVRDFAYNFRGEKGGFGYWFFRIITEFGYIFIMGLIVIALAIYTRMDYRFWIFLFVVLLSRVFNTTFKEIFQRPRPLEEMRWEVETSTSFPSGHSTNAGVIFAYLFFIFFKSEHKKSIKISGMVFCALIIPLVMFSRNILGVHYFTDVVAGASCGILCAALGMVLVNLFKYKNILTKPLIFKNYKKEELVNE